MRVDYWNRREPVTRVIRLPLEHVADLGRVGEPGRWWRVDHGVPSDATFLRAYIDPEANVLNLVYTHPSFDPNHGSNGLVVSHGLTERIDARTDADELVPCINPQTGEKGFVRWDDGRNDFVKVTLPVVVQGRADG